MAWDRSFRADVPRRSLKMGWVFFRAMTGSGGETGFMRARSLSGLTAKSLVQG